jgi:hypothetical protein
MMAGGGLLLLLVPPLPMDDCNIFCSDDDGARPDARAWRHQAAEGSASARVKSCRSQISAFSSSCTRPKKASPRTVVAVPPHATKSADARAFSEALSASMAVYMLQAKCPLVAMGTVTATILQKPPPKYCLAYATSESFVNPPDLSAVISSIGTDGSAGIRTKV